LALTRRSAALRLLQRVRDEAHRFGLAYHRLLRSRARIASELDAIPGVGPARRTALLKAFGSVTALRAAAPEQIIEKAGLSRAVAERVAAALSSQSEASTAAAPAQDPASPGAPGGDPESRRSA